LEPDAGTVSSLATIVVVTVATESGTSARSSEPGASITALRPTESGTSASSSYPRTSITTLRTLRPKEIVVVAVTITTIVQGVSETSTSDFPALTPETVVV